MDAISFENQAQNKNYESREDIFESEAYKQERQQAQKEFEIIFNLPVIEKKTKCKNPLCQSFTFVEHSIQASRADEPAILVEYCSQCGTKQ